MIESPALAVFAGFLVVATMALFIGSMYLGGGTEAIRRQIPQLALVAALLVAAVFAMPYLMNWLGDLGGVLMLVLNVAVVGALVRQARRGQGPLTAEGRRVATRMPAFRRLVVVWVAALLVGTILLILAGKAGY